MSRQMFQGNPVADYAAAGTARAGMTPRGGQMRQAATAEACLDEGEAVVSALRGQADRLFGLLPGWP